MFKLRMVFKMERVVIDRYLLGVISELGLTVVVPEQLWWPNVLCEIN